MERKAIIFDVETTGLDVGSDEVVSISIIDDQGNVLFDSLVKPKIKKRWERAERIHRISPFDVENAPFWDDIIPEIEPIFASVDTIIGYNTWFDLGFVPLSFFHLKTIIDVMAIFAPVYGQYDERHNDYKWQTLETAAGYYGYNFNAHNSLEDCKATLFIWQKMNEKKE